MRLGDRRSSSRSVESCLLLLRTRASIIDSELSERLLSFVSISCSRLLSGVWSRLMSKDWDSKINATWFLRLSL